MIDFVTIVYDNENELNLLKIQAHSFEFISKEMINKIVIVYNDKKKKKETFIKYFNKNIKKYYPNYLQNKIKIYSLIDFNFPEYKKSDWYNQQILKIMISYYIETYFYIILDGKNHFIKNINLNDFFHKGKPILYTQKYKDIFNNYYSNCFNYFNLENPLICGKDIKIQTCTPFIFIKNECIQLIKYVENKEKKTFYSFFIDSKRYTEFFFYYAWIKFNNNDIYEYYDKVIPNATVGNHDPVKHEWNSFKNKIKYVEDNNVNVFSIHRSSIPVLDVDYKKNLIKFYMDIFKENNNIKNIMIKLFNLSNKKEITN